MAAAQEKNPKIQLAIKGRATPSAGVCIGAFLDENL